MSYMRGMLGLGKVSREVLQRSVLPFIPLDRELELDGAIINLTGQTVIAHSPSIGVPLDALGFFAFHYAASNVACKFGRPTHLIIGIYLPLKTMEADLQIIAKNLGDEAKSYGVKVSAGQTATYYGLNIPLISTTCFGEALRKQEKLREGDAIYLAGAVGGEAVWLNSLSKEIANTSWRGFTPLPTILQLQKVSEVKGMHDVSEGGVKGAIFEMINGQGLGLSLTTSSVAFVSGAELLGQDALRAPTYGALIVVVKSNGIEEFERFCNEKRITLSYLGQLKEGEGLSIDGIQINELSRVKTDELYGVFGTRKK